MNEHGVHGPRRFSHHIGGEFCIVLNAEAGISDASGQDCYSAIAEAIGKEITPDKLRSLNPEQIAQSAAAMNRFFETKRVKPSHVAKAITSTLEDWS